MLMPKIDLEAAGLSGVDLALARGIIVTRGKTAGRLRVAKPQVTREDLGPDCYSDPTGYYHHRRWKIEGGETAYIWRMVAFYVSPYRQHHSMPVTCFFELPFKEHTQDGKALIKRLDVIVDAIVQTLHLSKWHGVRRYQGLV